MKPDMEQHVIDSTLRAGLRRVDLRTRAAVVGGSANPPYPLGPVPGWSDWVFNSTRNFTLPGRPRPLPS